MANMTTLQILQGVHDWVLDKIDEETANFITKTVNDLVNYYTKSETYTKAEVQQIVDAIKQFTYEVVQVRPTASASTMNKIYLVPAPKSEDKNVKEEYITIQDGSTYYWEMLGTTSIDLSNYYTKGQTDSAISSALSSALTSYTTTADLTTLLAQKQDVIQDLSDIRSGASAGSTAVQPSTLNNVVKDVVAESGVYDVSENNDNTKFESLSALLSSANLNTLIPTDIRKGGMSIKFIQLTPATYSVVKTEGLTEQPTGTEVQEALTITDGTYTAAQLPVEAPATTATYWLSVTETVEGVETTTYTTWVITKVTADKTEYVQYRLMSTTWSANEDDWQGVDAKPAYESKNLVESTGIRTAIRDNSLLENASSLAGSWTVDGTHVTFSGTGMNGTFTSHTAPGKPTTTRPYFNFTGFVTGCVYRMKLKVTINSTRQNGIGFGYAKNRTLSWTPNRLFDIDGSVAVVSSNNELDCEFIAVDEKWYIYFSLDGFGIDDSVTISDFSLERVLTSKDITPSNTCLNKIFFTGLGSSYAFTNYFHVLQKGHKYRFTLISSTWATPTVSSSSYLFNIGVYNENTKLTNIALVYGGHTPADKYEYTMTYDQSEYDCLRIGGRANENVRVEVLIDDITNEVMLPVNDCDELPVGEFVNSTSAIVVSSYVACVPHLGVKYTFVLPTGIKARVSYGANASTSSNTAWVEDGGSVALPATAMCQRINISKTDDSNLTSADVTTLVSNGKIKVLYDKPDNSIGVRNYDNEKYVKTAMYRLGFADSADMTANAGVPSVPTIVHTSDVHGDIKRFENAMEYAKFLGADAIISTGDNVTVKATDGTSYFKEIIAKYPGVPFLNCIGNHEVVHGTGVVYNNEYLFNNHISPYVTQGSYKADGNTAASMPYYYVDLTDAKIRMITINQFDNGCYYGQGLGGRLGQAQITWFCNTLLSTPEGYGVIIAMHANEDKVDTPDAMNAWNQTVNWDGRDEDTYGYCAGGLYVNSIRPIKTIVDAFISKTALSTTYDENTIDGNNGETVTINVDFSNVATGVEFICYLTGHRHKDNIGYIHSATNMQLIMNIVCTNCHYPRGGGLSFSEGCDIPRGDRGSVQDAFNVYGIDRQNGRVKIARVGSNVNFEGIERKFLIAPYKDLT